jgi:hypothetical protein
VSTERHGDRGAAGLRHSPLPFGVTMFVAGADVIVSV